MQTVAKPKPTGWADFSITGVGRYHFFGEDGRSLCGKWANMTRNILSRDDQVHESNQCAACRKKRATMLRRQLQPQ